MGEKVVDSYKFLNPIQVATIKGLIARQTPPDEIPWTPLKKPLQESVFTLVTTAGISMKGETPFDMETERRNPFWGDPSLRLIRKDATERDVEVNHLHIETRFISEDLNCALPLGRFRELAGAGEIGGMAEHAYSIMGYILDPKELLEVTAPAMVRQMKAEGVDAALFAPV